MAMKEAQPILAGHARFREPESGVRALPRLRTARSSSSMATLLGDAWSLMFICVKALCMCWMW